MAHARGGRIPLGLDSNTRPVVSYSSPFQSRSLNAKSNDSGATLTLTRRVMRLRHCLTNSDSDALSYDT